MTGMHRQGLRSFWTGLACLGLVVLVGWLLLFVRREPEHNGKPLHFWLKALHDCGFAPPVWMIQRPSRGPVPQVRPLRPYKPTAPDYGETERALLAIGPAAAPYLARDIGYRESAYARSFPWLVTHLPPGAIGYLPQPVSVVMVRSRAYGVLFQMGTNAASGVVELTRLAVCGDVNARSRAMELLGRLGDLAASAAPTLVTVLSSTNLSLRISAAEALGRMPSTASSSIPALLRAWRSGNLPVLHALDALTLLGYSAPETIPALISLLEAQPFYSLAADADTRAGGQPVERIDAARTKACDYLGRFGSVAAPAVPALGRMLTHSDSRVRAKAAWSLAQIGPAAAPAAPALAVAVGDYWWYVRENAAKALGHVGPAASSQRAALEAALRDANADVRTTASNALQRIALLK
jgi:HEAT repeat protein